MGCDSCGSSGNGKPAGCKSNGGCSTGGCNRMNVYDWLSEIPLYDGLRPYPVMEISFSHGSRKEFFRNGTHHVFNRGDMVAVEGVGGYDIGEVSLIGELVKLQMKKYGVNENAVSKRALHPATEDELKVRKTQKEREADVLIRSRAIARSLNLEMKLCEVEIQADGKKGTFFYTADQRVDFRELIKLYAGDFKLKVEMKQIGARQESGKVGGIGSCGRELCCSTWLTDFKSVNTSAARYQNLSINQTKLSGQCGRLKCCLNYELDTYMDALSVFPDGAESLETIKGQANLQKRDIFKNLMWYSYSDNNKQYPLSITRVREILALNRSGQKAEELQPVELEVSATRHGGTLPEAGFVNDVGQISLRALEKGNKKKKGGNPPQQNQRQGDRKPQQSQPGQQRKNPGQQPQETKSGNEPQGQRNERRPQQPRNPNNAQTQGADPENPNPHPQRNSQQPKSPGGPQPHKPRPPQQGQQTRPQNAADGQQRDGGDRNRRSRDRNRDGSGREPRGEADKPAPENTADA